MITLREACQKSPQLGLLYSYPAPGIIERIARDWDWIWIDAQHGQLEYADILAAVRACDAADRPAIVRVPDHAYGTIGKALDTAPAGIMVPMINTAEEARDVVQSVKFPPVGNRSYGARRVIDLHGRRYEDGQDNPFLLAQIETRTAMENIEEIAAVDGVDCLFIGLDDMAMRDGADMGKIDIDQYDPMLEKVAAVAKKYNRVAAGVFASIPRAVKAARMGFTLMCAAGDVGLLAGASTKASGEFKSHLEEMDSPQAQAGKDSSVY